MGINRNGKVLYGVKSQLGSGTVNISPIQQGIQQAKSELKNEYGMSSKSLYGKSIKRKKTGKSESKKSRHRGRKTSSVTKKKKEKRHFFITSTMYSSEPAPSVHTENVALFARPPINTGEEKVMWVLHEPCFVSKEQYSSVQFFIPGTGTQYTDLSRTELYVRIKIEDSSGDVFQQTDATSALPVDQILHSMWGSVDIKLNQKLVSTSGTNYMYKALLENLLNYSHDCKKIQMSSIGFSGESGNFTQTHPKVTPINYGLKERSEWFKKVSTIPGSTDPTCVEFTGPLMADICNQDRYILNGVDLDIKLWPNRDEFHLITHPTGTTAKLIIEEVKLLVCKVKLSPVTLLAHASILREHNALYPYQKTDVRTKHLAKGSYGDTLEDIYQGQVPSRLVVGFVESESYNGSFGKNPFHFQNFNLGKIGFYVDGESVP